MARKKTATKAEIRRVMSALGKRGGPARAEKLTPKERSESARKAAKARWKKAKKGK